MYRPAEPLVRHLDDKIWELREESHTDIYRLLYFFFTGTHHFCPRVSKKDPENAAFREIELALKRLARFIEREEDEL